MVKEFTQGVNDLIRMISDIVKDKDIPSLSSCVFTPSPM